MGIVPRYPKSAEVYAIQQENGRKLAALAKERGVPTRMGVPDGWAGKANREKLEAVRAQGMAEAKVIVMEMNKQGLIEGEDPRGDEAIEFACAIMRSKDEKGKTAYSISDRKWAANLIAAYCKAKPIARTQTKIETAEDFLGLLAAQATK